MTIMDKISTNLLVSILLGFSVTAYSSPAPIIPEALMYDNKPINPLCLNQEETTDKITSLAKDCDLASIVVTGQSQDLLNKGFYGFDYKVKDDLNTTSSYSYYKIIGNYNRFYTLFSISNTGGSGHFSSIYLVHRDNNKLQVKTLPFGGDRCNGGLSEVIQNKNMLSFSSNITPSDFLTLSNNNPQQLKAYDDLEACAACCIATAQYKTDLAKDSTQATLISIQFNHDADAIAQLKSSANTGYQACFNKLVLDYIAKNKTILTLKELNLFMDEFNSACTKQN